MKSLNHLALAAALATPALLGMPAQAQVAGISLGTIQASSDRGSYFQAGQVQDGNLNSAWGPNAQDAAPSLIFTLGRTVALSAIELKLSPAGAAVDVEVSTGGGAWRTAATGWRPQAETMAQTALGMAQGDRVRLRFHSASAAQLLVCEVRLYGETLAWTPSPTPVPVPVPTPVVQGPCTDVTGGGWVASAFAGQADNRGRGKGNGKARGHEKHDKKEKKDKKHKSSAGPARVTFGFNAHERVGKADWGQIEVKDHGGGQRFKGRVQDVVYQGNTVTFTGALGTGGNFTAVVTDNGRSDRFRFTTSTGYTTDGALGGGNIQVRHANCR